MHGNKGENEMKLSACDLEVYTKLVQIRNELANESRSIDRRDIAQRLSLVMENFVTNLV